MISAFDGQHKWLSNFASSTVYILIGTKWAKCPTVEHGFQASKTLSQDKRRWVIGSSTPGVAKSRGQQVLRSSYWEDVKVVIMLELLRQKFSHADLRRKLAATGDAALVEGNTWHDNFWGVCACNGPECTGGENWLGKLLMRVRKDIQ